MFSVQQHQIKHLMWAQHAHLKGLKQTHLKMILDKPSCFDTSFNIKADVYLHVCLSVSQFNYWYLYRKRL